MCRGACRSEAVPGEAVLLQACPFARPGPGAGTSACASRLIPRGATASLELRRKLRFSSLDSKRGSRRRLAAELRNATQTSADARAGHLLVSGLKCGTV